MVNKMIGNKKVKPLVERIISNWDNFAKIQFESWKLLYNTVSELTTIIEEEFGDWHGEKDFFVQGGKILFHLQTENEVFLKKCEERAKFDKGWKGTVDDCAVAFDEYRKKAIPLFVTVATHLEPENPLRLEIEAQMKANNYPMLF